MREVETGPLHVERLEAGAYWDVELSGSKGNILDSALIDALISIFEEAASTPEVKAICLRGRGKDFSFGASVREHLPGEVGGMLPRFHHLFRAMDASAVVSLAAVRGQCLGGGLELASFCHRIFAAPDAKLGQPEIILGVFAPVASLVLPERIGRSNAEDLCLTGRIVGASEAAEMGLVDVVTEEPEKAALEYAREHLFPRSASSLRHAVRALRFPLSRRLERDLPRLERLYLEELMGTEDATEGIRAFLEKRPAGLEEPLSWDGFRSASELATRAEEIYRDYRLTAVREWKKSSPGPAIGYMPIYVPRELLHAQGALPVGILGGGDDLEIIRGDAFYQSYICHIPRSTIELGLNGSLDCLDGMLFPAICDVIRNLSGIWKMQFPDKLVRYLDVPQDFDRDLGGTFYRRELEALSRDLAEHGGQAYEEEALQLSIATFNENRGLVRDLYALRQKEPWKVPTSELYCVLRASLVVPVEESTAMLRRYRFLVGSDSDRIPMDQARVVFTGSFCEQPPLGLIKTLERSGCYIVEDDFLSIHRFLRHDVPTEGNPLENLVTAFLEDATASPTRYIDRDEKGRDLLERVEASGAEGVLFGAPSFCDPALLDQPMVVKALEREGVPWTAFKYSENGGQFQVIREQAGTFADSIKLWSES